MTNAYLNQHAVSLPEFGCFVALHEDRDAIFWCPMTAEDTMELDDDGDPNWGLVTAPEPGFVEAVNQLFGTAFAWEHFAGR